MVHSVLFSLELSKSQVVDHGLRSEVVSDFVFPMVRCGVILTDSSQLGSRTSFLRCDIAAVPDFVVDSLLIRIC